MAVAWPHRRPAPRLAALSLTTYQVGFVTAQVFFSAWLFPLGWLVPRSGFLPRVLGWLLLLDGVAVLIWFLQALVAPDHRAISYPMWVIGFVAEVGLALWLLIKGTHSQTALTPQRLSMTPTRPPAARPEDMPARRRLDTGLALALASGRRAVERG